MRKRILKIWFGEGIPCVGEKYNILTILVDHLATCTMTWGNIPKQRMGRYVYPCIGNYT